MTTTDDRPVTTRDEVRFDYVESDGRVTHIDASAEATRYVVWTLKIRDGAERLVAVENLGTCYALPLGTYHWSYLAEKLGGRNERAGMALVHVLARVAEVEHIAEAGAPYVEANASWYR